MDILLTFANYGLWFLVVLTVLVFFHELGHYLIARLNKVRVEVFSIGFGPEIFGWTDRAGTRWKFSAIPLGGYVKMFGENALPGASEESRSLTDEERAVAFHCKTVAQRAAVVVAGPAANFVLAIVIFALLFAVVGQPFTSPEIGTVQPDSAAERAGLKSGDVFVEIDGRAVERFEDVQRMVLLNAGEAMNIVVHRHDEKVSLSAVPTIVEREDRSGTVHKIGILGVTSKGRDAIRHDPVTAVWRAAEETWRLTLGTLKYLGQMVTGLRDTSGLGGPIKIAQLSKDSADAGVGSLIWLIALLSINLGLINLFPIPMLDGGHLLFYAFEAVIGRPLGERAQEVGLRIGLALVICLMVFVIVNDITSLPFN